MSFEQLVMTTGFRYFGREMAATFVAVFVLLLVISLGSRFTVYLQQAAAGKIAAEALGVMIALRLPEFVEIVAPFALTLGVLVTWGRIHADREHAVFVSGGMGPERALAWVAGLAVPVALLVGSLTLVLTPMARHQFVRLVSEQRVVSEFDAIIPGSFRVFSGGDRVTFVEEVDREGKELIGVLLIDLAKSPESLVSAERGHYLSDDASGDRLLVLDSGVQHVGVPGQGDWRRVRFERLSQRIEPEAGEERKGEPRSIATRSLDLDDPEQIVELQWRISMPILTLIGALCALGVSRIPPRAGRFGRIVPGTLIFLVYGLALVFLRDSLSGSTALAWLGFWPVHIAFGILGTALFLRSWRPA